MILRLAADLYALSTTPLSLQKKVAIALSYARLIFIKKFNTLAESGGVASFLGARIEYYTLQNLLGIVKEVFVHGDYFFHSTSKRPFIIDCGANIGLASMYFAYLYPDAEIVAFEPGEEAFARLERNVKNNPILKNVIVHNVAASYEAGFAEFFENRTSAGGSTLNASIADSKEAAIFKSIRVRTIPLSSLITKEVDLLKMDIEGGELVVLKELDSSGALRRIKEIVFECHYNKDSTGNSVPEILSLLEKNGFLPVISSELSRNRFKKTPIYHFIVHAYRV